MSDPSFRELARRRGVYSTARNLRKQGCSLASAMRMLLGVPPIPVLTDVASTPTSARFVAVMIGVHGRRWRSHVIVPPIVSREPARLFR